MFTRISLQSSWIIGTFYMYQHAISEGLTIRGSRADDRFNDEIDAEGEAPGRDFRMYTGTGIYYRKKLILKKIFDPSIIFYFVDESVHTVYIIRVLRHERNWQKILREGISYTFD